MISLIKNKNKKWAYFPLALNIFVDANFTILGQAQSFFEGETEIIEGNPFIKPFLNSEIGRSWFLLYAFVAIYISIAIFIIEKLNFNKKLSHLTYLFFWTGHFMGLSGWWFSNVGHKVLGNLSGNLFIWFFSAISIALFLTYCLYNFWICKHLKLSFLEAGNE